jgi:hypothetical protein
LFRARRTALGAVVLAGSLAAGLAVGSPAATSAPAAPASATSAPTAPLAPAAPAAPASADIADQVRALPGVSSVTEATAPAGYRFFRITFTQPVDHQHPKAGTFEQRLTLLHKDVARPMVMYTGGYYVSQNPSRSEPTAIVDGNQLSMEYRFFDPSRPANPDWPTQLTIWQAATDQHRIIESFQRLYTANWITTGGSKGGMTATYHRHFYPKDVDGTVPYVAPNDVVDSQDVYNEFLDQVGTDPACRDNLTALQRRVLGTDRQWFTDKTAAVSAENGYTYDIVGDMDTAMESGVVDMYFAFWQYSPQSECANVPDAATATNDEVWDFFENVSPLTVYADQSVSYYTPYYYQAAYQLGAPEPYETRIGDLLRHPGADVALTFVPGELKPIDFDEKAMPDVDRWVRTASTQMLYIYGGNDPWGAEPFDCGKHAVRRECARYFVAGGTHGSRIIQLPPAERAAATAMVLDWAGLTPSDPAVRQVEKAGTPKRNATLDIKPDYLRRRGL